MEERKFMLRAKNGIKIFLFCYSKRIVVARGKGGSEVWGDLLSWTIAQAGQ